MNIATHQKDENEKTGKKETGEEKSQATDFKEVECLSSGIVHMAARQNTIR